MHYVTFRVAERRKLQDFRYSGTPIRPAIGNQVLAMRVKRKTPGRSLG
jgi:hypothetical protein